MSWLHGTNFTNLAKSAMKEAQKTFDSALDIQGEENKGDSVALDPSAAWGSFTGSFFEAKEVLKSPLSGSLKEDKSLVVSSEPKSVISVTTVQPSSIPLLPPDAPPRILEEEDAESDSTIRGSRHSSSTNVTEVMSSNKRTHKDSEGFEECDLNDSNEEGKNNDTAYARGDHQGSIMTPIGPELLLDEAMNDQSEGGSSSSKSYEVVKAINSGHTSGDEMETQTSSSDIEIISSPPPSSSGGSSVLLSHPQCSSPRLKKEKHFSSIQAEENFEEEDVTSSLLDSQLDFLEKISVMSSSDERPSSLLGSHIRTGSEISISGSEEASQSEVDRLLRKLKELNDVLDSRETKIVELSRLTIQLQEKNTDLSSQVKEAMKINTKLSENTLAAEEFTARLSTMEKKLQQTQSERDGLKEELKMMKKGNVDRKSEAEWKEILSEKDETISDLRSEGEALSKEVGKYSEHIKKLRSKDKASEKEIKGLKSELDARSKDCERLKKSLKAKDDIESKQIQAIQSLSSGVAKLEKENGLLKVSSEEALEKSENLRGSLESAYREMVELKQAASEREDEAQELALSKEMTAKMALQEKLRELQEKSLGEKESLYTRLDELRASLSQAERGASHREDQLRRERDDLQTRLEESENRLQEISGTVGAATLPLQRQIESLQASLREAQSSGEKVESSLSERLQNLTVQLAASQERDRSVSQQFMELSSRHSSLEVKHQELLKRRESDSEAVRDLRMRLKTMEESKRVELTSALERNSSLSQELSEARKEMELHQIVFQKERARLEARVRHLEGVFTDKDAKLKELQQVLDKNNLDRLSSRSSPFSSVSEQWGAEDFLENRLRNNNSFYDSVRVGGSSLASLVENYEFSLKQKDGEVTQLQGEVSSLERIRDSITSELSDLSLKAEKLCEVEEEVKNLNRLYHETEEKYQTMLTMYGEKVEETEELKLDLIDVKEMYKIQIQELLQAQRNNNNG